MEGALLFKTVTFIYTSPFTMLCSVWEATRQFISTNPHAIRARITNSGRTVLHFATVARHDHIMEKLVNEMYEQHLKMVDEFGYTALTLATR